MSEEIFLYPLDQYKRDIDPINHYIEQASLYISKVKNIPLDIAKEKIKNMIDNKEGPFENATDRVIKYTSRLEGSDRQVKESKLTDYINMFNKLNLITAPSLTTYLRHDVKESIYVKFVENNKKERSIAKKKKFEYKVKGDLVKSNFYDKMQLNKKISNNSLSGAQSSASTILYNKTAHSSLTSGTRITTSTSNSNNEKLLTGNRHYFSQDIIINNIIYIISEIPKDLNVIMDKYNLYYPTVEDVKNVILRSSKFYIIENLSFCEDLINSLSPLERAWFCYCNDFYHLCIFNESFFKDFLNRVTLMITDDKEYDSKDIYNYPEEYRMLGHQVCHDLVKGYGQNYDEMKSKGILNTLIPSIKNSYDIMMEHKDLFSTFFRSNVTVHNVANFPDSIRRSVLTSDTDSSIFTSQELVFWYLNDTIFSKKGLGIQAFFVLLSTYTTSHLLVTMCGQFNTVKERLKDVYMKNEFTFDYYATTQAGKHYYATISVQEGNVFKNREREVKGVHLKSSNLPLIIKEKSTLMMNEIMDKTLNNEKLSLNYYINMVYEIEKDIVQSIQKGDLSYFKVYKIKDKDSYKEGNFNVYNYYLFWNEIFGTRYGPIETLPYQAIKVSTNLVNKTLLNNWIESLDDDIKIPARMWVDRYSRKDLPVILLPADIVRSYGLPKEIISIVEYKSVIKELCNIFYILLETLGFYIKEDLIVSDYFI